MERNWREVDLADLSRNLIYGTNRVSTTRHTLLSFVPLNLLNQCKRAPILWFITLGMLQAFYTELFAAQNEATLIVVGVMIIFTLVIAATQDIIRYINDNHINSRPVDVWNNSMFTKITCDHLRVGNLVRLKTGDKAPADMLILAGSSNGSCLVDLKLLTGLKNFSKKTAVRECQLLLEDWLYRKDAIAKLEGTLHIPQPNSNFGQFDGKIRLKGYPRAVNLSISNFLPRDSVILKNEQLLCLVVYVGLETKMMLSNGSTKRKFTKLESRLNKLSFVIVFITLAVSLICAASREAMKWDDHLNFGEHVISFLLLYQHVIPITLFFLLDIIRLIQLIIIQRNGRFKPTTSDINDEIGQIEYLLTDKTGTLTSAALKLKICKIGNTEFLPTPEPFDDSEESDYLAKGQDMSSAHLLSTSSLPFTSLIANSDKEDIKIFLQSLVLCNTVYLRIDEELLGSSADEVAMVKGAEGLGYKLKEKTSRFASVLINGVIKEFTIYAEVPFDSETSRMSIVMQELGSNKAVLLVKGAPDTIRGLCSMESDEQDHRVHNIKNLRQISFCYKALNEVETQTLVEIFEFSRGVANEEGKVIAAIAEYQCDMSYIGAAFLEETIRTKVPETVEKLKDAGIKIWMATGDTAHSAYSAAVNSKITSTDVENLELLGFTSQFDLKRILTKAIHHCVYGEYEDVPLLRLNSPIVSVISHSRIDKKKKSITDYKRVAESAKLYKAVTVKDGLNPTDFLEEPYDSTVLKFTLTVDGTTFDLALSDPETRKIFTCLAFTAEAVLACRMLPSQKADLVKLLQKSLAFKPIVMAVGDGNNDIAMIRRANVGVGISTKFNSQAANSSDIMAKSFSDLSTLIFHHGLKSHYGLSQGLLLSIYGNLAMTLLLLCYNCLSDNSGSSVIDPLYTQSFCLFFFAMPILSIGTIDDISSEPINEMYRKSMRFELFSNSMILRYVALGVLHSGFILLYVYPVFMSIIRQEGHTETEDLIGVTLCISLVLTVLLQSVVQMNRQHPVFIATVLLSVITVFLFAYASGETTGSIQRLDGSFMQLKRSPTAIITMLCSPVACFSISYIYKIMKLSRSAAVSPSEPSSRLSEFRDGLSKVYVDYKKWVVDIEKEVYKIGKYTAKFKSVYTEIKFFNFYYIYQLRALRFSIGMFAIVAVVYSTISAIFDDTAYAANSLRGASSVLLILVFIFTFTRYFKNISVKAIIALLSVCVVGKFILEIVSNTDGALAASFTPPFIYTLFCVNFSAITHISVANVALTQISEGIFLYNSINSFGEIAVIWLRLFVVMVGITVISSAVGYAAEVNNRERFKLIELSEQEIQKTNSILSFLLPAFVKERVKEGARYIAEDQGTVTVVFCDIYDFDRICAEYSPSELTELLDEFFRKLDQLCDIHGVTKIETVGKTYMACAGLKDSEADMPAYLLLRTHARRGVDMALDIIRTTRMFKLKYGGHLTVKIGINSGPVTAGVVGFHKPQFALVGDTVNTASRMCSTLPDPNSIQITLSSYELMERYEGIDFKDNQVEAKGKGTMLTKYVRENRLAGSVVIEQASTLFLNHCGNFAKVSGLKVTESIDVINRGGTELISKICSCQFTETDKQKEFRLNLLEHALPVTQVGLATSLIVNGLLLLLAIIEYCLLDNFAGVAQLACRVILTVLLFSLLTMLKKVYKSTKYLIVVAVITLFQAATAMISLIENSDMRVTIVASEVIFVLLCLSHCSGLYFVRVFPMSCGILALWIGVSYDDTNEASYIITIVYIAIVILVNSFAVFYRENNIRTFANLKLIVDKENEKTEELLSYMMPAHFYENLKEGKAVTDRLPNVALLFADICGFTAWSSNKTPNEVVGMLSELFTSFDILCVQHDVFKVCTIGDCYVVMGYTGLEYRDPATECARVLEFAFGMIQVIRSLNAKHKSELNMRVGLHIGEVIAGITGTNIVRYDIYGPDVLIANKMESGGMPGRINVSDVMKTLVENKHPNKYDFEFNTEITAKSVNRSHRSFFVSEKLLTSSEVLS